MQREDKKRDLGLLRRTIGPVENIRSSKWDEVKGKSDVMPQSGGKGDHSCIRSKKKSRGLFQGNSSTNDADEGKNNGEKFEKSKIGEGRKGDMGCAGGKRLSISSRPS